MTEQLSPEMEAMVEARRICADTIGVTGLVREFYLDGTYDKGDHVRTTLAAYTAGRRAGREDAAKVCDRNWPMIDRLHDQDGIRTVPGDDRGWSGLTAIRIDDTRELVMCDAGPQARQWLVDRQKERRG